MGYVILSVVSVIFGIGWIKYKLAALTFSYYIQKKQHTIPTDDELKECTEFVVRNMIKDLFH